MNGIPDHDGSTPPCEIGLSAEGLDRLGEVLGALRALGAGGMAVGGKGEPERTFGRFRLRGVLGRGTFGVVFLADDPQTGRAIALKLPQPAALLDPAFADRFRRDVEAVVPLDHPGIVPILEAGAIGGVAYIAMPYVEGPTLAAWLARHPAGLPVPVAVEILLALADAAQHAHERGVLHCDLKPANVLLAGPTVREGAASPGAPPGALPDGRACDFVPRITDFGLARLLYRPAAETQTHLTAGTPPYMAPEQAQGVRRDLTARCDVHALAAILYELLTGRPPYGSGDGSLRLLLDPEARQAPPRALRPAVPRDLEAIVLKGLEKDPARRCDSARALADDLRRFQAGRPTKARPVGPTGVALRWVRRKPAAAALLAVTALAAVAAVWVGVHLSQQSFRHSQEIEFAGQKATLHEFTALLERVRQRRMERPDGWADANLEDVRRLAGTAAAADFQEPLRSEAAQALAVPRLRLVGELAPGKRAFVAAFSPDGQTLALGEHYPAVEGWLRVWLVRLTGEITRELRYPVDLAWERLPGNRWADGARSVVFSPDGRWLVVGTRGSRLIRWDLEERNREAAGPVTWVMDRGDGKTTDHVEVRRLVFTRDGSRLLSGSQTGARRTWDVRQGWKDVGGGHISYLPANTTPTGELVCLLLWHPKPSLELHDSRAGRHRSFGHDYLSTLTFCASPDGQRLAADIAGDRPRWLVRTDNPGDRRPLVLPEMQPSEKVQDLGFSPDGRWLWFTSEDPTSLELWDAVRGTLVTRRRMQGGSGRLAVSPDSRHVAVCEHERTLLFELTPSPVRGAVCEPGEVKYFAVSPDGARLATVGWDLPLGGPHPQASRFPTTLYQRTRQGFALQRYLGLPHAGLGNPTVAFSPRGDVLMAVGLDGGGIGLRSLDGGWLKKTTGRLRDLRFGPDGRTWAVAGGRLVRWSAKGQHEVVYARPPREEEGEPERGLQVGPRGVLVVRGDGQVAWFDDRDQLREVWRVFDDQKASSLAWGADGGEALVGGNLGGVARLRLPSGEVVRHPQPPHRDDVVRLAYLPGGVTLTASADHTVRLWDGEDRLLLTLREAGPIENVAVSPGGREVFVHVRGEWGVRVWDLAKLHGQFRDLGLDPGFTVGEAPVAPVPLPGLIAELYADKEHTYLLERRRDPQVDFAWGKGPPSPWVPADNFSIRWTGWLRAPQAGDWELKLDADDEAALWLDGVAVFPRKLGCWGFGARMGVVRLPGGPVSFRLDYAEHAGEAHCRLAWRPPGGKGPFVPVPPEAFCTVGGAPGAPAPMPGLVAELYADKTHTNLVERRRDAQVYFDWGEGPPSPLVPADHFSIRWAGRLRPPRPGDWEFMIDMNDGAKLWLDGRVIFDIPRHGPDPALQTAVVSLPAKPVSFRLDYYEITGQAHCKLLWRPAGSKEPFVPVPPEAFSP